MCPRKVLTSFHQRREFDVSHGESSVTEAVFIEVNNNTLFKYIYAHKQDTRYVFEKADHEVIPIKGPLTEL